MHKIQVISLFFEDMQDNVEEFLVILHKLLRELQSLLFKKIINPAAKRIGADLFEIAAPKIGEIVSRRKKNSNHLQTMWEQKQFGNNWEVGKNKRVELVELDPFLEKVDRKTVALANTFLTIKNECKPKSFSVRGFYKFFIEDF